MQPKNILPYLISQGFSATAIDRFWKYVSKANGCWLWTGGQNHYGYGAIARHTGTGFGAHRLSWIIHYGPIPEGDWDVCHRCDVRHCVNPAHLFLGNAKDNIHDSIKKGRFSGRPPCISSSDVARVKALYPRFTQIKLAEMFHVSEGTICRILTGKRVLKFKAGTMPQS